jgi:hypothetical protein
VAISDPATAHFTAHKNLGNTDLFYFNKTATVNIPKLEGRMLD